MTLRDMDKILKTVPEDWEIMVWPQKYGRHGGQLILDAHFTTILQYKKYGLHDYLFPQPLKQVVVYAVKPGFDETLEWK